MYLMTKYKNLNLKPITFDSVIEWNVISYAMIVKPSIAFNDLAGSAKGHPLK